jgi:hypothetical protein
MKVMGGYVMSAQMLNTPAALMNDGAARVKPRPLLVGVLVVAVEGELPLVVAVEGELPQAAAPRARVTPRATTTAIRVLLRL